MKKQVLISGASIAGLSTAYWLTKLGYQVTIVEISDRPRMGGSPIDVRGIALETSKRMGIFDELKKHRLHMGYIEFKNKSDESVGRMLLKDVGAQLPDDDIEIGRDDLVSTIYQAIEGEVAYLFKDSILRIEQTDHSVVVTFKNQSQTREFDLLIGCDGLHSNVRKLWFGPEKEFAHFLGQYFSITKVDKPLIEQNSGQMYNIAGKAVTLYAYNKQTDVIFAFLSENEIPYDYRDVDGQKQLILEQFKGEGWRTAELLSYLKKSESFYFDKLAQIKMATWTKGRVALVGDAGYCASPASGMGASLSILGAAALAEGLLKFKHDYEAAFQYYNESFRPFVDEIQPTALIGLDFLVPKTEEAIQVRNAQKSVITGKRKHESAE